jgi:hypothetical protein
MSRFTLSRVAGLAGLLVSAAACGRSLPVASAGIPGRPSGIPQSGLEVIGAMRRAHPSRELRSLAFSVTVIEYQSDSTEVRRERAHALLPGRLRLEAVPVSRRSGIVRNGSDVAVFERGRRVWSSRHVDLATLLAYDLFAQSIDTTIMWLDSAEVRFGLLRLAEWNRRKVWVVGAPAGDTTSAQFWVDAQRWRVVRVIQRDRRSRSALADIRFDDYTELHDVPVPRRVAVYRNGRLVIRMNMKDFVANPTVPVRVFDPARWRPLDE